MLDPDTYLYDAFINVPWSWYMHVWCIYQLSLIIDSDACVYDAHIYGNGPWHACMYGAWIYDAIFFGDERTDERTNKAILGVWWSFTLSMYVWYMWLRCTYVWCISHYVWSWYMQCMYDAYIYVPRSLTLMHVCMMHIFLILICAWCINVCDPRSLTLPHACMMRQILFRTNGPTDKVILGVWCAIHMFLILIHVTMMHTPIMHLSMTLDPDTFMYDASRMHVFWYIYIWCMCEWCTYLWSWALILKQPFMYDPWPWCMYVWCI